MSVIVLGMEMPKVCITEGGWYHSCPMDRTWCAQRFAPKGLTNVQIFESQECKIPDWCPLRPLPEKHGRLGDLDELKTSFADSINECKKWIKELEENGDNETLVIANQAFCTFVEAALRLKSSPTIVEAEGD